MVIFDDALDDVLNSIGDRVVFVRIPSGDISTSPSSEVSSSSVESSRPVTTTIFNDTLQMTGRVRGDELNAPGNERQAMAITVGSDDFFGLGHTYTPTELDEFKDLVCIFAIPMRLKQ